MVVAAQVADRGGIEDPARSGQVAGDVELVGELGVGVGGAEPSDELNGGGVGAAPLGDAHGSGDDELVAGAGVPADPDPGLGQIRLGKQGDIGDKGAQEPLAVPGSGGGRVPQP